VARDAGGDVEQSRVGGIASADDGDARDVLRSGVDLNVDPVEHVLLVGGLLALGEGYPAFKDGREGHGGDA